MSNFIQGIGAYRLRRLIYAVVSLVLVVLSVAGLVSDAQVDQLLGQLDNVAGLVAALVLVMAAGKANPGSDVR